jgi:hypothetical protein
VPVTLTASKSVQLDGLDDKFYDPKGVSYSVQDVTGNIFYLIDTTILTAGENTLLFRAKDIGQIEITAHAINRQYATPRTEIIAVDNATSASILGKNGETDPQFRNRIKHSQSIRGSSAIESLSSRLLDIDGMQSAVVYENFTDVTDSSGVPPHAIWVIVNGGANEDIGMAIASTLGFGVGQKVAAYFWTYKSPTGMEYRMYFDRAVPESLKMSIQIFPFQAGVSFEYDLIRKYIKDNLTYSIGEPAESATITCLVNRAIADQGGGAYPSSVYLWKGNTQQNNTFVVPTEKINIFSVNETDISITVAI